MADTPVPIAVVGIGCRLPGGANTPELLWQNLAEGRDAWADVPEDRFNWRSFMHADPEAQGTYNHRGGHFIDQDIAAFDAGFFNIPPFESEAIDPQQRIQLEVAYEALENAGIPLERVRGSDTAVYAAVFSQDYAQMQFKDLDDLPKYHMTGTGNAIVSNRISYLLDLKGPSITLDTGCSGGLVAIHQACQSLRSRECGMALAGGVNLLLSPDLMIPMSLMHILNKDGKCYSFDTRGSGYGRGEGAAMVVLKRLDDAVRDGDHIRGIIRNSGVNHDGTTPGITLPSRDAQKTLIKSVYQRAGLDPRDTAYIEAHGTGTAVGDVEEISAIQSIFGKNNDTQNNPFYVGSIKPNIGHLESASGVAGFIKAVLMLEKGAIPPNINLEEVKGSLNFIENSRVTIPTSLEKWPMTGPRRISINSFGYGGTNGHAIIDGSTPIQQAKSPHKNPISNGANGINGTNGVNGVNGNQCNGHGGVNGYSQQTNGILSSKDNAVSTPQVLALSAKNEKSLIKMMENLREWVSAQVDDAATDDDLLLDLAYTLTSRRSLMQWRCSFTATSLEGIVPSLDLKTTKPIKSSINNRTVFVFTGQGAQWFAMGRELMSTQSPYQESMYRADRILTNLGASWSLVDELSKDEQHSRINESKIAQPATTAIQVALVDLLHDLGIEPHAVLGHSSGEIAAAYAAGALNQFAALKAAYHRGLLVNRSSGKGAMLAVGLGREEASKYTSRLRSGVAVVACSNSPSSSTISGDEAAIIELKEILDAASIFARRLKVDMAYHSHHVRAVADEYLLGLDGLESRMAHSSIKFISSVTADEKTDGFGPEYWVRNLVSEVRFRDALEYLCNTLQASAQSSLVSPIPVFVELGPHSALSGPIRQTVTKMSLPSGFFSFSAFSRNKNALSTILELAGKLFEQGCEVDLPAANLLSKPSQSGKVLTSLPPYAWDHSNRHWHESRLSKAHRFRQYPYHDLLGLRVVSSTSVKPVWRHILGVNALPWLREHTIEDLMIFPGSAYMSMAIEAVRQVVHERDNSSTISKYILKDVSFISALVIPEAPQTVEIQLSLSSTINTHDRAAFEWKEFRVVSVSPGGGSIEHCRGLVSVELETNDVEAMREEEYTATAQVNRLDRLRAQCFEDIDCSNLYDDLKSKGNYYGPNFARVKDLKFDNSSDNALGTVVIPNVAECMPAQFNQPHIIHPTTLDSLLHAPIPLFNRKQDSRSVMATGIGEMIVSPSISSAPNSRLMAATTLSRVGPGSAAAEVSVFGTNGNNEPEFVLHITEGELRATGRYDDESNTGRDMTYQMKWDVDSEHLTSSYFKFTDAEAMEDELAQEKKLLSLNQAAAVYIHNCLQYLSMHDSPSLFGHYRYFFDWMIKFQQSSECRNLIADIATREDMENVLRTAQQLGVEGEMLCRVGEKLPEIVTEKINPLALMIEDDLLYRLYADDASTRCYTHMIRYVKHAIFKNPNMTVLELGAGTGGATAPLLQAIGRDGVLPIKGYDFTDVSAGFFERSKARLEEFSSYLQFKTLDIQGDLVEQGFVEQSYDLIIASNVLHVANFIDVSLSRARKLLKPGGRLLMIETTEVIPFYNTCIGVLPGWWGGVDDGRTNAPLLSIQQWNNALLRTGFNGIEVAAKDYEGSAQRSAMLVSKAVVEEDIAGIAKEKTSIPVKMLLCPNWSTNTPSFVTGLATSLSEMGLNVSMEALQSENTPINAETLYIVLDDGEKPILTTDSPSLFTRTTNLLIKANRVLWVSAQEDTTAAMNPEKGLIAGAARVARGENQSLHLLTIDIQESVADNFQLATQKIKDVLVNGFYTPGVMGSKEFEYSYKEGQLLIPRLVPDAKVNRYVRQAGGEERVELQPFHQPDRPLKLQVHHSGLLEKMRFVDDETFKATLPDDEIEVQVEATGVNFKDIIVALGQVKKPLPLSGEFAGTVVKVPSTLQDRFQVGDRVCGFGSSGYASRVQVNGLATCRLPESMSFIDAASAVVAFSTAHHALVDYARLEKGQSILIHSASGGVGQAAVKIAQHVGAEIFATVGSDSKRLLLIEQFGIPEDHILSSMTGVFKKGIQRLTNGRGVDVVLNALSGQLLQDSWDCIATFGTFVDLGKSDAHVKSQMSMAPFDRHVTFASIDLSLMHKHRPAKVGKLLANVLSRFEAGIYTPINPVTVMPMTDMEDAFRLMQARKHVGKIVLEANPSTMVKALSKPSRPLKLHGDGTYLIAGGTGGLGVEIAQLMADHGAKNIVLFSRRGKVDPVKRQVLEEKFSVCGARLAVFACDVSNAEQLREMVEICSRTMPPIKGVIQASMALQDRVLAQMDVNQFHASAGPKVAGTQTLIKALEDQPLDFFLMFSSGASIIGNLSQANYAAGNAFMDTLANSTPNNGTHFLALNLGPICDAGALATNTRLKQVLIRQGYMLVKLKELLATVEYSMSDEAREDRYKQIILGFDHRSLRESDNKYSLENPMFCHLLQSRDSHETKEDGTVVQSVESLIAAAENMGQVENVVAEAIARKISTLVAVAYEEMDLQRRVVEYGLDSLVVIELKNWATQKFQAALQASEISDAPNIIALAATVASGSALVGDSLSSSGSESAVASTDATALSEVNANSSSGAASAAKHAPVALPKQPLPDLDDSLDQYLEAIRPVFTDKEFAITRNCVEEFRKPSSFGRELQRRLEQLANDPQVDSWQADLYASGAYLRERAGLIPRWNFFGTHFMSPFPHSPAQRAAIISSAAFQFKQKLDGGELDHEMVNEQAVGMELYSWFFNASREPRLREDKMVKYPGNDYLVAFRRGHVYKIPLRQADGTSVSYQSLKKTFQAILDTRQKPVSWAGILTADDRDSWTQVRQLVKDCSPENQAWLQTIEAAAFVIYLDEAKPRNSTERGQQFLQTGFNRWADKTVQFVVCDNGVSATIGEHAMLDGVVIRRLNDHITAAIMDLQPEAKPITNGSGGSSDQTPLPPVDGYAFQTTTLLNQHIQRVRTQVQKNSSRFEFAAFEVTTASTSFFRKFKCPPKSSVMMAIQLAIRRHFGYSPGAFETVSLSHFQGGRVELNHVIWPEVAEFLTAAVDESPAATGLTQNPDLRRLFFEGMKTHAKNLFRASSGHGIDRHLQCLQWSIQDGEEVPSLFSNPYYPKSRNANVMTDSLATGVLECGAVQPEPNSFWIHFEPEENRVRFSIWGPTGQTMKFKDLVEESVQDIRAILEQIALKSLSQTSE
ncbi:Type I Iterative PKS [Arachnomyces sp. PD_36]|nr:Type I Iterative PKS [Arachnomyces sp. PD_36]